MKSELILPSFNVSEEIMDYLSHYGEVDENTLVEAIGKTPAYVRKSLRFLNSMQLIDKKASSISLVGGIEAQLKSSSPMGLIKKAITKNSVFKEYCSVLNKGRTEKKAAKYVIASAQLDISEEEFAKVISGWTKYLNSSAKNGEGKNSLLENMEHGFMWIDENGHLIYDEQKHTDFIVNQINSDSKKLGEGSIYVDPQRIQDLELIENSDFDLSKLIQKCKELNIAYSTESYFSVGMLTRSIIDHVPPIFGKRNFSDVAGGYGTRSFKDSMNHLDKSSRKIADSLLHTQIRKKEVLPSKTQVNFSSDLDVLLAEIIRILK